MAHKNRKEQRTNPNRRIREEKIIKQYLNYLKNQGDPPEQFRRSYYWVIIWRYAFNICGDSFCQSYAPIVLPRMNKCWFQIDRDLYRSFGLLPCGERGKGRLKAAISIAYFSPYP